MVKKKTLFKSYYCAGCKQRKPCQLLNREYCCSCYYEMEQAKSEEYSNYQQTYQRNLREREAYTQQYQLLKNYQGCKKCSSKEVDTYHLYQTNQLVCQTCLIKKTGGASSPISFLEQSKLYKRYWKIEIVEWLKNYQRLPVNADCARKWLEDKENLLNTCDCLEDETKGIYLLSSNSLREYIFLTIYYFF